MVKKVKVIHLDEKTYKRFSKYGKFGQSAKYVMNVILDKLEEK